MATTEVTSQSRAGVAPARAAAVLGTPYAALNIYWAAGGTAFLDLYGSHIFGRAEPGNVMFRLSSAALTVLMLVAVVAGVRATGIDFDARTRPVWRWTAWMSAGWLALYGGIMTLIGAVVPLWSDGVLPEAEVQMYRWHALVWDPWYLIWGLLLVYALLASAKAYLSTGRELR